MTDLKSYPHPVGIKNNGLNNCYYNSIIQVRNSFLVNYYCNMNNVAIKNNN